MSFEEGPLYYREIQKNAYLKRVPNETSGSKFMQLGYKKVPPKPMWTLFCIHNGRTPYLEQYVEATSPSTLSHKPVWSACLRSARHVTASVTPRAGGEHDFLVDTDHGAVRMIASDWDTMQDWVSTLRSKLHELKILSSGENVYCAPPAPPAAPPAAPRAPARDPTSPLPPVPRAPPARVPGIELIPPRPQEPHNPPPPPEPPEPVDISNWEEDPQPSTSSTSDQPQSVAKICGQNICLDDSILRRREVFVDDDSEEYRQTVKVEEGSEELAECENQPQQTNITVIQVSNKNPPHTAIPVLGPETDVFNFDFNDKITIQPNNFNDKVTIQPDNSFVNIVNTEDNTYGAVFNDGDYGHISLTTTVNLTDPTNLTNNSSDANNVNDESTNQESVYERLCLASTSNENVLTRLKNTEKVRKSSLPNLDTTNDTTYECLFPNNNGNTRNDIDNGRNGNRQETRPVCNSLGDRVGSNIERSMSQNAYDGSERLRERLLRPGRSPKRDGGKNEKREPLPAKPIWKRGLTEFSLLTKLRLGRRHESPTRQQEPEVDSTRVVTSPVKVVRRSRPSGRIDGARRRSSSLTNGLAPSPPPLQPLRVRQAGALQAEQRRGAAVLASVSVRDPPVFVDYEDQVWICEWGRSAQGAGGRAGDRLAAVRARAVRCAAHAAALVRRERAPRVDILFHRVPLGKIYVLNRRENESLGIQLDAAGTVVERGSALPPGRWALTEVNNRPVALLKGGAEEMLRASSHDSEVSLLLQPAALVQRMRAALAVGRGRLVGVDRNVRR